MKISKTGLQILEQIANGNTRVKSIAKALKKSTKQIYVEAKHLDVKLEKGVLQPNKASPTPLLLQLMSRIPNLPEALADSGIPILKALPATIAQIEKKTGLKKTIIYKKLKQAISRSMVKKRFSRFEINEKLWSQLKEYLEQMKKFEATRDERIPASAIIYYKKGNELVFSIKEYLDAALTAFSAYEKYGIKLLTITNYYYLPKKNLKKTDILKHSLYIAEKGREIHHIIFIALLYAKFKEEFKNIKHPIIQKLQRIFKGEKIPEFPSLAEIKDRAEVYHIKIR